MGPTCSIIYENEPMEKNIMQQKPRPFSTTFFNWKELVTSIVQGLIITAGTLYTYQLAISKGYSESLTRTMVFTVLISANVFLTLVNRSFHYSVLSTMKYKNNMVRLIILVTVIVSGLVLYLKPLAIFFKFERANLYQTGTCIAIGFISVIWFEATKFWKRIFS